MSFKIEKIRDILKEKKLDGFLVSNATNVSYLAESPITDSYLLLTKGKNILLTDFRYILEAQALKNFTTERIDVSFVDTIASVAGKLKLKRVGFEGRSISYSVYVKLKKALKKTVLIDTCDIVEKMRAVKERSEVGLLRKAVKVTEETFFYIRKTLRSGMTEEELKKRIAIYIKSHNGAEEAFSTIVASGPNAAKPHANATTRKIGRGEPIIIDFGVKFSGYNSDLTRTFYLGKMDSKFRKIYDIVLRAQEAAISFIRPGRIVSELDLAGRDVIKNAGFGKQFGHALGRGIGRDVHESPKIFKTAKGHPLMGMVLTVEPAVYIRGWGGVRIEDVVLVTKKGCEVLTDAIYK